LQSVSFSSISLNRGTSNRPALCARRAKEARRTVCLTSYRSLGGVPYLFDSTKIWQACRATTTETIFFDPIAIGLFQGQFVGDAVRANPPVKALRSQAQDFWGDGRLQRNLRCLMSIETGANAVEPVRDDAWAVWRTLKKLVRESEKAVEESFQIPRFKSRITAKLAFPPSARDREVHTYLSPRCDFTRHGFDLPTGRCKMKRVSVQPLSLGASHPYLSSSESTPPL
jgi:hypothetical protein